MSNWIVPGTVIQVIDGDTVRVDLDLGPHGAHRHQPLDLGWHTRVDPNGHIRLVQDVHLEGIDAPETPTPEGKASRDALRLRLPVSTRVEVVSKKLLGSTEKYGRILGDLRFSPGPEGPLIDVAEWMLTHDFAKVWTGRRA